MKLVLEKMQFLSEVLNKNEEYGGELSPNPHHLSSEIHKINTKTFAYTNSKLVSYPTGIKENKRIETSTHKSTQTPWAFQS